MVKKNYNLIIGVIFVAVVLFFIFFLTISNSKVNLIDVDEFETLVNSEKVFVINTHTPYTGEIQGTDLIAEDWKNMNSYLNQLPEDKDTPIAIYCRSGRMSGISAQQLVDLGYTNIYDLDGGMKAWAISGREVVFDEKQEEIILTGETKEFEIIANDWAFTPNKIEVNLGNKVILHVESVEGNHGIALYDFGVNEFLAEGDKINIEFIANKKGTFNFFCNVMCGSGHGGMGGKLIVK